MNKSIYLANKQLGQAVGGAAYSAPATLYFALYTAAPTAAGGGTEVSGGGYVRKAIANNTANFAPPSGGVASNASDITWAPASAGWGTVVAVGVFDGASGNLLYFSTLATPRVVASDSAFSFSAGSLVWTES